MSTAKRWPNQFDARYLEILDMQISLKKDLRLRFFVGFIFAFLSNLPFVNDTLDCLALFDVVCGWYINEGLVL